MTSRRLLNIASLSKKLHVDATFKPIWQGFPVLIPGTTDGNRKFHGFGLAVCTTEKKKILHSFFAA